jgi:drug/metabolite transporter (DMT)-like permease
MENQKNSPSLIMLKWGAIGGLLSFIFTLITKYTGLQDDFSETLGWVSTIITLILNVSILVFALREVRDENDGFLRYGQGLGASVLLGAIWGLVAGVFNYIYLQFIDNGLVQKQLDLARERLEEQGLSNSQIEDAENLTRMMMGPGVQFVIIVFVTVLFMFLLGLVVSGILKREKSVFDE